MGQQMDQMILDIFSNVNCSLILCKSPETNNQPESLRRTWLCRDVCKVMTILSHNLPAEIVL